MKGTEKAQGFTNIILHRNLALTLIDEISKNWNGKKMKLCMKEQL